jgi:hypothetical protein
LRIIQIITVGGISSKENKENINSSPIGLSNLAKDVSQIYNSGYKDLSQISSRHIWCSCGTDVIAYYCRLCNIFICRQCRINEDHKMHLSVHVDPDNLEESIKLYAISLQADINLNLKASKKYQKSFQSEKFIDPTCRKEMIIRKLDELERKQEELLKSMSEINQEEINIILNQFDGQAAVANDEIDKVIEKIYHNFSRKNKRISFEDTEKYFKLINSKEKDLEKFNYNILAYKYNFQVHKKIDEMYKIIEKAIDAVLISDINKINMNDSTVTLEMHNSLKRSFEYKPNEEEVNKKSDSIINNMSVSINQEIINKENFSVIPSNRKENKKKNVRISILGQEQNIKSSNDNLNNESINVINSGSFSSNTLEKYPPLKQKRNSFNNGRKAGRIVIEAINKEENIGSAKDLKYLKKSSTLKSAVLMDKSFKRKGTSHPVNINTEDDGYVEGNSGPGDNIEKIQSNSVAIQELGNKDEDEESVNDNKSEISRDNSKQNEGVGVNIDDSIAEI